MTPETPENLEALERYAERHTSPLPAIFDELQAHTQQHVRLPQMQVGLVVARLLHLLATLVGARRVVEVGTYTGYSALALAEALPPDGEVLTCERDPERVRIARSFFDRTAAGRRIRIVEGDALLTLRALPQSPAWDLAFVDADKDRYPDYYEELVPRLRPGGLVVLDNALQSGRVLCPEGPGDRGIVEVNRRIVADPRVESVLLTVRDGVMIARKREIGPAP